MKNLIPITLIFNIFLSLASAHPSARVKTMECPVISTPIKIDSKLDEPAWDQAATISDFIQIFPAKGTEGIPAKEPTTVYLMRDKENLYVAFKCFAAQPENVVGSITTRDNQMENDDSVTFVLDTYHDGRTAYSFRTNPIGTQMDLRILDEGGTRDIRWDGIWKSASGITHDAWIAEFAIPSGTLRYGKNDTWGILVFRNNRVLNEVSMWPPSDDNKLHVSQFGHLSGMKELQREKPFDFTPASVTKLKNLSSSNPHPAAEGINQKFGLDVKYRPLSNVTANFTLNPDFAHMEADLEQINLSRQELRLPEKRPFFIEGLELLNLPIQVVYTRRMQEIAGGAKMTGKFGGNNFVFFDVQTKDTEQNFSVFRLKRDVLKTSALGLMAVNQQGDKGYSRAVSVDSNFLLTKSTRFNTQFIKSWNSEKDDDGDDWAYQVELSRWTDTLGFTLNYQDIAPQFKIDAGYIPQVDRKGPSTYLEYTLYPRKYGIANIILRGNGTRMTDHNGVLRAAGAGSEILFLFKRGAFIKAGYSQGQEVYEKAFHNNQKLAAGGIDLFNKRLSFSLLYLEGRNFDRYIKGPMVGLTLKPMRGLAFDFSASQIRFENPQMKGTQTVGFSKVDYQFTNTASIRLLFQTNLSEETRYYSLNSLLIYRFLFGSTAYLAYNEEHSKEVGMNSPKINRLALLKISYLFRL